MNMIDYRKGEATVYTEIAAQALKIPVPMITQDGKIIQASESQLQSDIVDYKAIQAPKVLRFVDLDKSIWDHCVTVKDHLDVNQSALTVIEDAGAAEDDDKVLISRLPEDEPWGLVSFDALPSYIMFIVAWCALEVGLLTCT
ncbi:unnamed protein product [Alternaria sp. RS040]